MALDKFLLLSGLSLHIRPQELVYPFGKAQGYLELTLALWRPRAVEVGGRGRLKWWEGKWQTTGQGPTHT